MAAKYQFSAEELTEIRAARRVNRNKRVEARLMALEMRAQGRTAKEISVATGFHAAYVTQLVAKYRAGGLEAISGNHYPGNRRNMSREEEAAILEPFRARAERGEPMGVKAIAQAYQDAVDHPVSKGQIYSVLHRHGWRRVGAVWTLTAE